MSIGIGAFAYLVTEDENTVMYEYGNYNLNDNRFRNEDYKCDGIITICRDCFQEPKIHKKMKKMPSGKRKLVIKRIVVDVDYLSMIQEERIMIENSKNCWSRCENGIDIMAMRLLSNLFKEFQIEGKIPKLISLHV